MTARLAWTILFATSLLLLPISGDARAAECENALKTAADDFFRMAWGALGPRADHHVHFYRASTRLGVVPERHGSSRLLQHPIDEWLRRADQLGVPAPGPRSSLWQCNTKGAAQRLDRLERDLGADSPYLRIWVANQHIVFSNCADYPRRPVALPEAKPPEDSSPQLKRRAADELRYQTASALFYARVGEQALTAYREIAADTDSLYRLEARFMVVRSLVSAKRVGEALAAADDIFADPSARDIHAMTREALGAAAYKLQDSDLLERQLGDTISALMMPAEQIASSEEARRAYDTALTDIDWFVFRAGPRSSWAQGWWLGEPVRVAPRAAATRALSGGSDMLDWLQTMAASAYFYGRTSWIAPDDQVVRSPGYMAVTAHALERWRSTGAMHWAVATAARAMPGDAMVPELPRLVEQIRTEAHHCRASREQILAYPLLLHHALRVALMGKQRRSPKAAPLLEFHAAEKGRVFSDTIEAALVWFIGTGDIGSARYLHERFAALYSPNWDKRFGALSDIVATEPEELFRYSPTKGLRDGAAALVNLWPVRELIRVSESPHLSPEQSAELVRVAWTRAKLLGYDRIVTDLTPRLRALHPGLSEDLDRIERSRDPKERQRATAYMLLRTPRMGTRVNGLGVIRAGPDQSGDFVRVIDTYNHNDNNWWCRYDLRRAREEMVREFFDQPMGLVAPRWGRVDPIPAALRRSIEDGRSLMLARHELVSLVDEDELRRLGRAAGAPTLLPETVIAWAEEATWLDRLLGRDELIPEALHRVVVATRYGCQTEGSHAAYSRRAFELLHARYGGTEWALRTRYWFGCAHFRNAREVCPTIQRVRRG